ncbi:hypothetical protein QBK99_07810 [Corticibacterium sp. UT-5YL-CI-8]|nr:hypothetical protein [Tianweitania sp. UT-5YL-CI-8]
MLFPKNSESRFPAMKNLSVTSANDFDDILGGSPASFETNRSFETSASEKPTGKRPWLAREPDLAAFWGVDGRTVRKLVSEAAIEKLEDGRFDVSECTKRYLKRLVVSAKVRNSNDPELRAQKLRIAQEQADQLELKNQEKRGELVSAKDVESEWADVLRTVRAGLLAVPARVGARLALPQTHLSEIDIEIRAVLKELGE